MYIRRVFPIKALHLMVFALLLAGLGVVGSVLADADGPDTWRVVGVRANDYLNLRRGPSTEFRIVARIPHNATGLTNAGCYPEYNYGEWQKLTGAEQRLAAKMRWCKVVYDGNRGWVYGKFVGE